MRDHRFPADAFPAVVAHRGAPRVRPENTLSSFEEALRLGARIVELDVRLTADAVPIVLHDAFADRTTDGNGPVHELSAAEVARLNAGTAERPEPVPTLADALALLSGRAAAAIEIKVLPGEPSFDPSDDSIVTATMALLDRSGFEGPVLILSFHAAWIEAAKVIAPRMPTGFLTSVVSTDEAMAYVASAGHDMVLPRADLLAAAGPSFVAAVHAAGRRVGTWTVDDPAEIASLLDRGVDAVASNDVAAALSVLAER